MNSDMKNMDNNLDLHKNMILAALHEYMDNHLDHTANFWSDITEHLNQSNIDTGFFTQLENMKDSLEKSILIFHQLETYIKEASKP